MNFIKISLTLAFTFNLITCSTISQSTELSRQIETLYNSAKSGSTIACPFTESITCNSSEKFASLDGSCNNLLNPYYGKSTTPLKRLLSSNYEDGIDTPKANLPNPRVISTSLLNDNENLEPIWTHIYATFGQFLVHDLIETSVSSSNGTKPDCPCDSTNSACFSFSLPAGDIFDSTCMKFVRSTGSFDIKCDASQREQLNLLSSFIDGNMIYGHSTDGSNKLRTMKGGYCFISIIYYLWVSIIMVRMFEGLILWVKYDSIISRLLI